MFFTLFNAHYTYTHAIINVQINEKLMVISGDYISKEMTHSVTKPMNITHVNANYIKLSYILLISLVLNLAS